MALRRLLSVLEIDREADMVVEPAANPLARTIASIMVAAVAAFAGFSGAAAQGDAKVSKGHVDTATATAGTDLVGWLSLCRPARIPSQDHRPGMTSDKPNPLAALLGDKVAAEPMKVFDNLYFVGTKFVTAWAITTSQGIILVDALNNDEEAERVITGGLRKVGLDPAQIKYLVISHGHGDHYGGAGHIVEKYKPRVVMSEIDWRELEKPVLQFDNMLFGRPPKRDLSVADGHTLELGDTVVELYVTPGHTLGTLTTVFTVKDGSTSHRAMLWGGTAFNFGQIAPQMRGYVASADRMRALAARQKVDVMLANHVSYDAGLDRMARLAARRQGEAHPYVIGPENVARALTVIGACARSFLTSFDSELDTARKQ
jgi:metallo-beta-lactamase class B